MAKFCGNCGSQMDDTAKVCGNCGTPFGGAPTYTPPASTTKKKKKHPIRNFFLIVLALFILIPAFVMLPKITGTNGLVLKTVNAIAQNDTETLDELTSSVTKSNMFLEYSLDSSIATIQYRLGDDGIGYEITNTRSVDADELSMLAGLGMEKAKIKIVDVSLVGMDGSTDVQFVMIKESGKWKLLSIQ